jgi:hypothetical protein
MSWAVDFANLSHRKLSEYEKSYYEYNYVDQLNKRTTDFRNYDELRWFLLYNAKKLTDDYIWFTVAELNEILDFYVEYYKDDRYYTALKNGESFLYLHKIETTSSTDVREPFFLKIYSLREALQHDLSIDYQTNDTLKRHLFKQNILNETEFLELVESRTRSFINYNSITEYIESLFNLLEEKLYPNYNYIDQHDLKDIILQLSFEESHSRGFFSDYRMTIIHCKENHKRNFVLPNN